MDRRKVTTCVLLNLPKAFDKVNHNTLLQKCKLYGIIDPWFESYLRNRSQAVKSADKRADFLPTSCGVPQGSCLGPVLFSIYTNELPSLLKCPTIMYADDTQLITSYKVDDQSHAENILQENLIKVEDWMKGNHLTINGSKTQVITFGTRQQLSKVQQPISTNLTI